MIQFKTTDFNLSAIKQESKLFSLITKNDYSIYGMSNEGLPPVLISAQEVFFSEDQEKILSSFLKNNGINVEVEDCESTDKKIYIGLRKDLREDVLLCAALIQSIIYFCEGRLELSPETKIPTSIKKYEGSSEISEEEQN